MRAPSFPHQTSPPSARRRVHERGAVMVEAVILLPIFVLILAGNIFLYRSYAGRQRALNEARTCAWIYSANACEPSDALPSFCQAGKTEGSALEGQYADKFQVKKANAPGSDATATELNDLQNKNPVSDVFNDNGAATATVPTGNHPMFGGEHQVSASYHLPCNLRGESLGDMLSDAWKPIGDSLFKF